MFFNEFYALFTNHYEKNSERIDGNANVTVALYVSNGAVYPAYVGNEYLPEGVNPFAPPSPSPSPKHPEKQKAWIAILLVLVLLLIGIISFIMYKLNKKK